MEILLSVVAALIAALLCAEGKAWLPVAVRALTKMAVKSLPAQDRERYAEEWAAYLEELPGALGKVFAAAGFVLAAKSMARHRNRELGRLKAKIMKDMIKLAFKSAQRELTSGRLITRPLRAIKSFRSIYSFGRCLIALMKPAAASNEPMLFAHNVLKGMAKAFLMSFQAGPQQLSWNVDDHTGEFVEAGDTEKFQLRVRLDRSSDKSQP